MNSEVYWIIRNVQARLGVEVDGVAGLETWKAIDKAIPLAKPSGKILRGNGHWPFFATIVGEDIVVNDILITCFGGWGEGINDPQDKGGTASGMNTARQAVRGVSIAMDGRMFSSLDPREHRALDGAPIPRLFNARGLTAWHTQVEITLPNGSKIIPEDGIVDLGPGIQASHAGEAHALDVTPLVAQVMDGYHSSLKSLARGFSTRGSFRIIGGAKLIRSTGEALAA